MKLNRIFASVLTGLSLLIFPYTGYAGDNHDEVLCEERGEGTSLSIDSATIASLNSLRGPAPSPVDILIVYTPNAESLLPSDPSGINSMVEFASAAVAQLNSHLQNSYVRAPGSQTILQARLVHTHRLSTNETGIAGADLDTLGYSNDGIWDEVHTLRSFYGADLVHIIVGAARGSTGSTICGLANTLRSGSILPPGLSLSRLPCTLTVFTFSHEIGHTLGAGHDNNSGYYAFSRGYTLSTGGASYSTIVANQYAGFTRIGIFSSPQLSLSTGEALGTSSNDNRLTISDRWSLVSNYKPSRCRADYNSDGVVSVQDIYDFLSSWSYSQITADFNGSGQVSVQDIYDYLTAWSQLICTR